MIVNLHNLNNFKTILQSRGDHLILGGPGTGKTAFLKEFIIFLTENQGINPKKILVLTFNRRSSKYLRDEIAIKADKTVSEIEVKTFYSFCLDIYKDYFSETGLKKIEENKDKNKKISESESTIEDVFINNLNEIRILTAPEQWNLLTEIILEADEKRIPGIKKLFSNKNTRENIIQEIFDYILRAQENFKNSSGLSKKFNLYSNKMFYEINLIYSDFNKALNEKKAFNYGKLLTDAFRIVNSSKDFKQCYKERYKYILVDELHELNYAQYSLLKEISDNNIVYFGDDDQSIYKFRGSNINIFFKVHDSIPEKRKIYLINNFRNSYPVLKIIENFISKNSLRVNKDFQKSPGDNSGDTFKRDVTDGEIIIKSFENKYGELNFIKNKIIFLNRTLHVPLSEISIIMKGTDFETDLIENYFYQNNIPFLRKSSRLVINNRYSGYLLNICRLIVSLDIKKENNNEDETDISKDELNKRINLIARNILLSDFMDIDPILFKEIEFKYLRSESKKNSDIYEFLRNNLKDIKKSDEKNYLKILNFIKSVNKHKKNIKADAFTFVRSLIDDESFGFLKEIKNYSKLPQNDKNLFSVFTNYLTSIRNFCSERESEKDIAFYLDFIERFSSNQFIEETEEALNEDDGSDGVRIISFYDCKNVEFDVVFIPFLNKGYFPSAISKPQIYENDFLTYLIEGKFLNDEAMRQIHLENERKILYTGISRCRKYLYITSTSVKEPSPFYEELQKIISGKEEIKKIIPRPIMDELPLEAALGAYEKSFIKKKAIVARYRINVGRNINERRYKYLMQYLKNNYSPDRWWDIIEEKDNDLNPFIANKYSNYFSYSAIDAYDDCPFKYKMKYFLRLRTEEENMSLIIGSLYHNIINRFFNESKKPDIKSILLIMEEELNVNKDNFKYDFYFNEIKNEMNKNFINFYKNFSYIIEDPSYPDLKDRILTEKEFIFNIGFKDRIKGKIDLINLRSDNIVELIDFKSSKKKYSEKDLEEELQLKIYYLAMKRSDSLKQVIPDIKKRIIVPRYYVIGSDKDNFFTVNITEKIEEKTIEKILDIISNIKKEKFEINPRNYFSCKSCEYKIFCTKYYGEQI
ncbi:MAG: ATP-dependent DNA helicase [Actinomycetota bacterium]|nr:ATP-dependent DNA helicase [Actinomycetota bacterium]